MLRRFGKAAYDFGISVPIMGRLLRYRRHTLLLLFVLSGVSVGAVFVVLISREVHKELRQRQAVEEVRQRGGVAHRGSRMNYN